MRDQCSAQSFYDGVALVNMSAPNGHSAAAGEVIFGLSPAIASCDGDALIA
jgi:hypothetical protein